MLRPTSALYNKYQKRLYLAAALLTLVRFSLPAWARDLAPAQLILNPESRVWLTGTSTLHPYASTSTLTKITADLVPGKGTLGQELLADIARRAPFQKFEVLIPVRGLKSGESGLDKNMYKALKVEKAPEIRFTLAHYETKPGAPEGSMAFQANGTLAVAGAQKDIVIHGEARSVSESIVADGTYSLLMSDYGIKPPKLMLGAIKVADPVVIHFHLSFRLTKGDSK